MRRLVLVAVAALVLTGGGVAAGTVLLDVEDDPDPGPPPFATTALESYDTSTLAVARSGFCEAVDLREVEAALGTEPVEVQSYDNGEVVTLADGVDDVAHEFGCLWQAPDQSTARAWVFAPPVDAQRAARLVREAGREPDCEASATPPFGSPSVGVVCRSEAGGRASYQGLFGDAWLTCELNLGPNSMETDAAGLLARTGAWCVGVAKAASGTA